MPCKYNPDSQQFKEKINPLLSENPTTLVGKSDTIYRYKRLLKITKWYRSIPE